ncbi:hypothetical protein Tco_0809148 [Tanacetum coccineum]
MQNTKFTKKSILEKPPSSSKLKLYSVTPLLKSNVIPKVGETNALSKLVTSNSAPYTHESKVVKNDRVISPGIFRIHPFKAFRVDNFVPNKHVKASVRIKPITVSQPHVVTKKDVNSNINGFSPTELAIRNDKSEVVCAMCKQCLVTANHDVCVLNYVSDMNSSKKNQRVNVLDSANQKKHKPNVKKSKKLGSEERLASYRPSKPRTCLRWLPTGRIFDLCKKITASSNTESLRDSRGRIHGFMESLGGLNVEEGFVRELNIEEVAARMQLWNAADGNANVSQNMNATRVFRNPSFEIEGPAVVEVSVGVHGKDHRLAALRKEYPSINTVSRGMLGIKGLRIPVHDNCFNRAGNGVDPMGEAFGLHSDPSATHDHTKVPSSSLSTSHVEFLGLQDGDGISISRMAGSFMSKKVPLNVNSDVGPIPSNINEEGLTQSPLVSLTAPLLPHQSNVDVAAIFGVSFTTVGDLEVFIKDIDAGKHEELLFGMTNDKRKVVIEALGAMCDLIETQSALNLPNDGLIYSIDDVAALFGVPLNSLKEIDEFTKDLKVGKYAFWSTMTKEICSGIIDIICNSQHPMLKLRVQVIKTNQQLILTFILLVVDPVFDGVNIFIPRKVVEKVSTRFEYTSYGYFIGKRMAFPVVEYYARNN